MLFLAIRHLLAKKKQTILILFGIILGTGTYVFVAGMMMGFQTYIIDQLVNNDSHIRITARSENIPEEELSSALFKPIEWPKWQSPPSSLRDSPRIEHPIGWFERLDDHPQVLAYSPQFIGQVIYRRGKLTATGRLIGIQPDRQAQVTNIKSYIQTGKLEDIGQTGNRVILGSRLMKKLGAEVSETIFISMGGQAEAPFKIVGRVELGVPQLDEVTGYGSLAGVQTLAGRPSEITDIAIRLTDVTLAGDFAESWGKLSKDKVQSWDQANTQIMSVFKMQDMMRNFMTIAILVVAAVGIYNILSIMVNQKKKEIAILRSIGYEPNDILRLFLSQGLILGFLGGLVGLLAGFLFCSYLSTIQFNPSGLGGGKLLISFAPWIYQRAFILAFLSSAISSLLPARSAGKMTPIDIIRSESS